MHVKVVVFLSVDKMKKENPHTTILGLNLRHDIRSNYSMSESIIF